MSDQIKNNAEKERLAVSSKSAANMSDVEEVPWKKWGPYLSERQWGTVREDYSANGDAWNYSAFFSAIAMAVARSMGEAKNSKPILIGRTWCCSTNTSTATTGPASARVTRPAGWVVSQELFR
jgi:hypothetical protein